MSEAERKKREAKMKKRKEKRERNFKEWERVSYNSAFNGMFQF